MNTRSRLRAYGARLSTLLGSASLLTMAGAIASQDRAYAGEAMGSEEIPENVLITGSLIRGTVAVGVPVVNLSPMDFAQTGALTTADLFKNFPAAVVQSGDVGTTSGARIERGQKVNLRRLDGNNNVREIMMVDGLRTPPSGNGICAIDPSIIPSISLDHIDVLVDGASATYGSDAETGVINLVLRRNFDGAMTQLRFSERQGGGRRYQLGQLWGRTWDGGQITLSYEWYAETPVSAKSMPLWGVDFSPWGYDNRNSIGSSSPGIITRSPFPAGSNALGTACGYNTGVSPGTASTCYSIPLGTGGDFPLGTIGPTSPFSASTLNWATFSADTNFAGPLNPSAGTRNAFNPYSTTWYSPDEQRNGGAITVDQRLTKDISFYGSAFYSNRRANFINPNNTSPSGNNSVTQVSVPTTNPYYPTGGAPTNLRVSYDLSIEQPTRVAAYELASRYQMGLNISLPAGWEAQVFYSQTYDSNADVTNGTVNKNAISAALGWTIAALPPQSATGPSFGTWTKPANIPYLNLFCDPNQFQCNSRTTLLYLDGGRTNIEKWMINEKGIKADGPLFDLPGGTVKMAVGADLTNNSFSYLNSDNTNSANLIISSTVDALHNNVWATFAQINVPIFSDSNAIFGFRQMDLEVSWRHDQYDAFGGTSNPKVAFNWSPIEDFMIRGSWGSNFRAPQFAEISTIAKAFVNGYNLPAAVTSTAPSTINLCGAAGAALPNPQSGGGKIQWDAFNFNNAMAASGAPGYTASAGCINNLAIPQPTTPYVDANGNAFTAFAQPGITAGVPGLLRPGGFNTGGGAAVSEPVRRYTGYGLNLTPETATNWAIGAQYTPTNILRGLDIQATYWIIKISNLLTAFPNPTDGRLADPTLPFAYPSPHDIGCPDLPNSLRPSIPIPANLVPSACPLWIGAINGMLANPKSSVLADSRTVVYWINDGAEFNQGWIKRDGIDFSLSYDWDMGNIGSFNLGATGTLDLHGYTNTLPGSSLSETTDLFHTNVGSDKALSRGVATIPPLRYRGRLGWSDGAWNVTGFVNYESHYYNTQSAPPNVNGNFCTSTSWGAPAGGTFPCAQSGYTNLQPPWYTFDLSIGYDTGEEPANNYLKNIGLQLVIQNLLDKHAEFYYKGSNTAGPPTTISPDRPNFGRQISVILTKTW
jgi:outer membrane receptor protein involved in Fe transport